MSPLKWLRDKAKRKPAMATGGYVAAPNPGEPPIIQRGCGWAIDLTAPRPIAPDYVIMHMRGYTEMTDEERRQFLDAVRAVMGRPASHR